MYYAETNLNISLSMSSFLSAIIVQIYTKHGNVIPIFGPGRNKLMWLIYEFPHQKHRYATDMRYAFYMQKVNVLCKI